MTEKTVRSVLADLSKEATKQTEKKIGLLRFFSSAEKERERLRMEREKVLKSLTPEEKEITKFLSTHPFGCNNDSVVKLESLRAGKPLPVEELDEDDDEDEPDAGPRFREEDVEFLTMLVPLANWDDHDYPIGKPCLVINREDPLEGLLRMTSGNGNELDNRKGIMRTAVPEEIDSFFAEVPAEHLRICLEYEIPVIEKTLGKKLTTSKKSTKKSTKKAAKKKPLKKKARRK